MKDNKSALAAPIPAHLAESIADEMAITERGRVRHARKRANYQRKYVYQLVDDLKLGHMGFAVDNQPFVIPLTIWRVNDHLFFHCANKSRLQRHLEGGHSVCLSFAEATEWVMAKSAFHHSTNYRSAVVFCTGERVVDEVEFDRAFKVLIDQIEPDRWHKVRPPNKIERKATALMKLKFSDGAFKSRTGEPSEEPDDLSLPVWHGTLDICPAHQRKPRDQSKVPE
ncbi:MAG: pyridoxamine 5'-phosphate oxidase family protein [Pseudomonadales bacterium]|nr:pyridoxamine 5'-phosphate oxidase family protein [Pseudomonadales bacterium]